MLHPSLTGDAAVTALAARWAATGSLRVEPFLAEPACAALAGALVGLPFALRTGQPPDLGFQYWAAATVPEDDCDHALCRFGAWLWSDGAAWLSRITALALAPPDDRLVIATWYRKGCYLDPHNDWDGRRRVAFILGLTRDTWPAADGGHLEFLRAGDDGATVVERRPPGWNTLDLFDVRAPVRLHAVPLVRREVRRHAIAGWLY